jgi:hypothetical protein
MKCPRCQHDNETGAKFCEECAAPLARACAKCGRPLSSTAKFCPECAHPTGLPTAPPPAQRFDSPESYTPKRLAEKILTSKAALEGERKQVTVLFADLKGSMELLADRDPARGAAHSSQNFASASFSCWQREHLMTGRAYLRTGGRSRTQSPA